MNHENRPWKVGWFILLFTWCSLLRPLCFCRFPQNSFLILNVHNHEKYQVYFLIIFLLLLLLLFENHLYLWQALQETLTKRVCLGGGDILWTYSQSYVNKRQKWRAKTRTLSTLQRVRWEWLHRSTMEIEVPSSTWSSALQFT